MEPKAKRAAAVRPRAKTRTSRGSASLPRAGAAVTPEDLEDFATLFAPSDPEGDGSGGSDSAEDIDRDGDHEEAEEELSDPDIVAAAMVVAAAAAGSATVALPSPSLVGGGSASAPPMGSYVYYGSPVRCTLCMASTAEAAPLPFAVLGRFCRNQTKPGPPPKNLKSRFYTTPRSCSSVASDSLVVFIT
jgi:hypothetical protein